MDQRIINLYDEYTHKPLKRSEFLERLVALTGSLAAALSVIPLLESCATAPKVSGDSLFTESVTYPGATGDMKAYIARPAQEKQYPAVMVIHENRGLNAHIEDVTRRVATAGYLAIAPDALSSLGGTPSDTDKAREMFSQLDGKMYTENFHKGLEYARTRKDANGSSGCVGFCWGGAMANQLAVQDAALKAAVSFYGSQPSAEDVPKIRAAIQLHYGGLDERINAGIPAFEKALKEAGIVYELYMYENVNHAFHNDTSPARYNEAAARLAWGRTLEFFKKHVG